MAGARRTALTTRMTLLVVVICVLILTLAYPLRLYLQQQSQLNGLAAQNADQHKRVEALKTAVAGYDDPEWTRDEARTRLHFTQPGETVYLASAAAAVPSSPVPTPGAAAAEAPWFSRLWSDTVGAGAPSAGIAPGAGQAASRQPVTAPSPSATPR
ncbi:septum formation initiator family protein [Frankia sp. Cas3]|uniref:FtsB family cell division protein n=1 Tax=Frankia sp. Cas3 TaxID=3073926 RepID=UPI002AD57CC7|nr:septum formation initiator family protein [Frankia sp. Cas3]